MIPQIREYTLTKLPVADIQVDPTNPNKMTRAQMSALTKSMNQFGYLTPVIVDADTMMIADGEHRYQVYKELGYEKIPAYVIRFENDAQRRMLRQIMNKLHGEHDKQLDADDFVRIMESTQQNLSELADMITQPRELLDALVQRFHPEVEVYGHEDTLTNQEIADIVPVTKLGDIWQLGPSHLLICGDCTDATTMQRLFNDNATVAQLNTDPPYGVDYASKNHMLNTYVDPRTGTMRAANTIETPIINDDIEAIEMRELCNRIFENIEPYWDEYNTFYIFSSGLNLHNVRMALYDSGLTWGDYLIWLKRNPVLGRKDYKAEHEFIVYGWKGKHEFYGPYRSTVLEYAQNRVNDLHPTMKPIELIQQTVTDGTKAGDIVLDCFAGAGSSLIACEQTGRKWRGIELDPHYCDVIVARWEKYTQQKAICIGK